MNQHRAAGELSLLEGLQHIAIAAEGYQNLVGLGQAKHLELLPYPPLIAIAGQQRVGNTAVHFGADVALEIKEVGTNDLHGSVHRNRIARVAGWPLQVTDSAQLFRIRSVNPAKC